MSTANIRSSPEPSSLEDPLFIAELRRGNAAAYEKLVRTYSGRLLAITRRYLRNDEDARDALQEAFLSAFRALPTFEGGSQLSTWLHRIAVNAALMKLRTRRRKPEETIEDLLPTFLEDGHQADPTPGWREPAEVLLQQRETRALVRECIERLPESYRTVLLLRDIEELGTEEAAQALNISLNAVKIRLHRARQALRELLDPHFRKDTDMTEQRVTCRELIEFLWKYLGGELSAEERTRFDTHLERCAKCVQYLQTYQDTIKLGKFALEEPEEEALGEVPEELIQAILSSRK